MAMGNPTRSKKFHGRLLREQGTTPLPDQISGMKELAKRFPYVDIDRAGIYGHSGGGFATADAMFRYPDFLQGRRMRLLISHQRPVRGAGPSMLGSHRVFQNTSFPEKNARFTPASRAAVTVGALLADQYSSWPAARKTLCCSMTDA